MPSFRPYGRNKFAVYLEAGHPALARLRRLALSVSTYSLHGKPIGFDLAFKLSDGKRIKRLVAAAEAQAAKKSAK